MKQIVFTLMLFVIVLSPLAAACQALPDSPVPQMLVAQSSPVPSAGQPMAVPSGSSSSAAGIPQTAGTQPSQQSPPPGPPNGDWRKIQRLIHGEPIVVTSTYGPSQACRFAGATDDALFCDAPGAPDGSGYRFERATVISVQATRPQHNYHPAWIASVIGGGLAVGIIAAQSNDAGDAARIGAVGALVVGAIGAPLALLQPQPDSVAVVYRPRALRFGGRGPLGLRPR
jgi:hypothetical protein